MNSTTWRISATSLFMCARMIASTRSMSCWSQAGEGAECWNMFGVPCGGRKRRPVEVRPRVYRRAATLTSRRRPRGLQAGTRRTHAVAHNFPHGIRCLMAAAFRSKGAIMKNIKLALLLVLATLSLLWW